MNRSGNPAEKHSNTLSTRLSEVDTLLRGALAFVVYNVERATKQYDPEPYPCSTKQNSAEVK